MEHVTQTRTERCRYGQEQKLIDIFKRFHWDLASKRLLNRFGNPLPFDSKISERDLREKCQYELIFNRTAPKDIAEKADGLLIQYQIDISHDNSFGKGRIFACVVLTILSTFAFFGALSYLIESNINNFLLLLAISILIGGGIIPILWTGIARVTRINNYNREQQKEKEKLLEEADKLFNE